MTDNEYRSLVEEHIALLAEARQERDHHKQNVADLGAALTAEQLLNAELVAALKAVDEWLMDGFSEEDADDSAWRKDFRKALKLTKSVLKKAESQ